MLTHLTIQSRHVLASVLISQVIHRKNGEDFELFSVNGAQGMDWVQHSMTVRDDDEYEIRFTANKGNGNLGDIAIDDVKITTGRC